MRKLLMALGLLASVGANAQTPAAKNTIKGEYVEARTASVFAGPCHYNGELTTTGREAQMFWNIKEGSWNGVSLSGLTVMAAVTCEDNLVSETAHRRSVLYLDPKATEAQEEAVLAAFKKNYGKTLGCVISVKRTPLVFAHKGDNFRAEAQGIGKLAVDAMPNRECCKQPNMVCYKPMVELKDRRVGFTRISGVSDKLVGPSWTKQNQNTAFYGAFAL